jgi:hypothetical protein
VAIESAVGGILLKTSKDYTPQKSLSLLDAEILNRLSFPWIVPTQVPYKRLALVEGRANLGSSEAFFRAARTLGVGLVILDKAGH